MNTTMTESQILAAIAALPDCDLLAASKITDAPGADQFYSARTVVKLLAIEREACAALADKLKLGIPAHEEPHPVVVYRGDVGAAIRQRGKP
jgi:hypothetical protein